MSSRRPLRWLAGFGLGLAALLAGLNWRAHRLEGPEHLARGRAQPAAVAAAEAIIIGSSVAAPLSLKAMCLDGVNIAHTGQDIFEIVAIADHLIARGIVANLWLVAIAADSQFSDYGSPGTAQRTRRIETYRLLQSVGNWRLIENDWQGAVRAATLSALGYDGWRYRMRNAWRREVLGKARGDTRDGALPPDNFAVSAAAQRADARRWLGERKIETDRIRYRDDSVPERNPASLTRLAAKLERHGARLVMLFTSLAPSLRAEMAVSTVHRHAERREFVTQARRNGVLVFDDTDIRAPLGVPARFRDATHLNRQRGLAYSRDVGRRLASGGIIRAPACEKGSGGR